MFPFFFIITYRQATLRYCIWTLWRRWTRLRQGLLGAVLTPCRFAFFVWIYPENPGNEQFYKALNSRCSLQVGVGKCMENVRIWNSRKDRSTRLLAGVLEIPAILDLHSTRGSLLWGLLFSVWSLSMFSTFCKLFVAMLSNGFVILTKFKSFFM